MDAITLLKEDHKTVEKLFKRFEKAGDRAYVEKRDIVDRIIEELSKHAAIEEQLFYPVTRATVDEVEDVALESLEEHHIVKWVLSELEGMDPTEERFDAKVTVLMENVRHHVEEEESDYFPKVRAAIGRKELGELGDAMKDAKATAPTHPHPEAPDTPPGNLVAGGAAAAVDRVGDTVKGLAKGSLDVAADLVGRIQGRSVSRPSPSGSSTQRKAATKTREAGNDVADRAKKAVNDARDAGEEVTKRATRTAKATTTSARRGAKNTATTAKRTAKTPAR